ncbi:MAG: protein-export chaperone SecB [Gammaproteobacteria bacterium]
MATNEPGNAESGKATSKQCNLLLLYVKDVSFEAPAVPGILFGHEQPTLEFDVSTTYTLSADAKGAVGDVYAVHARVTVKANAGDKTLFLIEVDQGGLFEVLGYPEEERDQVLRTKAPDTLYPYARELVSSLVSRAGFPRLQLKAINFESRYSQAMQEHHEANRAAGSGA